MRQAAHSLVRMRLTVFVIALAAVFLAVGVGSAFAQGPYWKLSSSAAPRNLPPGGEGEVVLLLNNFGASSLVASEANRVKITDKLPPGITATSITGLDYGQDSECQTGKELNATEPSCTYSKTLLPYEGLKITIHVKVSPGAAANPVNEVFVSGANAPAASIAQPLTVSSTPASFGVEKYEIKPENEDGSLDNQAGSHPFQLTTSIAFNQAAGQFSISQPKNLKFNLPPGLIGNVNIVPQCSEAEFLTLVKSQNLCKGNTAIGVAAVDVLEPHQFTAGPITRQVPVFNLKPIAGEPARFGIEVLKDFVILDTSVRTGADYGVNVTALNNTQVAALLSSTVSFWGTPGDPSHDPSRGWECIGGGLQNPFPENPCKPLGDPNPRAFLSLPTSCGSPLQSPMEPQSWERGSEYLPPFESEAGVALVGCGALPFSPSINVQPDTSVGNTPAGLTVGVTLPQTSTEEPNGLSESAVKDTTVTLPPGVLLSPSAANGLQACPEGPEGPYEGIGFTGFKKFSTDEPTAETPTFTHTFFFERVESEGEVFQPSCPDGSKVGLVKIHTPDLPHPLEGGVYLAAQNANPFGSLLAMYIVAEEKASKTLVKLAGEVSPDPNTGQITTTFKHTPQVPFDHLELKLFGHGEGGKPEGRASITTPPNCGAYSTESTFTPWSTGIGVAGALPEQFGIGSRAEGASCAGTRPFGPSLEAGSENTQGGAFTNFALTLRRPDSNQEPTNLTMHLPGGIAGILASVELCHEADANAGTCPESSKIGDATATAGLGNEPFTEGGGRVYITEKYNGAPFGLSIVIPTKAGPFDFGNVVTRSTINIDPTTAALTIGSPLPTMVNTTTTQTGIPVQLKQIHVVVDRANFQFNPTNCKQMTITGDLTGSEGGTASATSNFAATNCASLPFKPKLTASAAGKATKGNGTTFTVKLVSPGLGQANIEKVFLTLPKALPSRLTTIQKACLDSVFEANPAGCDEGSVIGHAIIHTPVLKNPLEGPAYLVSHGNAAFPDVEFVLQGEGVKIVLDGKTDIKKGITYSRFETAPDAPFTTFETVLPAGPHSALTANVPESKHFNLCGSTLQMPTEMTAQNGTVIRTTTPVGLTGCPKVLGSLTRVQKLAAALKACRHKYKHNRKKRAQCEKQARRKYGAKKASHHKKGKRK